MSKVEAGRFVYVGYGRRGISNNYIYSLRVEYFSLLEALVNCLKGGPFSRVTVFWPWFIPYKNINDFGQDWLRHEDGE